MKNSNIPNSSSWTLHRWHGGSFTSSKQSEQTCLSEKVVLLCLANQDSKSLNDFVKTVSKNPTWIALLNEHFISIHVDSALRPDIDAWCQSLHLDLTGHSGGWPLIIALDGKTKKPFFSLVWGSIEEQSQSELFQNCLNLSATKRPIDLTLVSSSSSVPSTTNIEHLKILDQFNNEFLELCDPKWGGFSGVIKAPMMNNFHGVLQQLCNPSLSQREALFTELIRYAESLHKLGLRDPIEGGFFRYCQQSHWSHPDFCQRTADNLKIADFFIDLAHFCKSGVHSHIARQTIDHILSLNDESISPIAGISDWSDGAYFGFDKTIAEQQIGPELWSLVFWGFGFHQAPINNRWYLQTWYSEEVIAEKISKPIKFVQWKTEEAKQFLLTVRKQPTNPLQKDNHKITANAANLSYCLNKLSQLLHQPELQDKAVELIDRIAFESPSPTELWRESNLKIPGLLQDHAAVLNALFTQMQCQWRIQDFEWSLNLLHQIIQCFLSPEGHLLLANKNNNDELRSSQAFEKTLLDDQGGDDIGLALLSIRRSALLIGDNDLLALVDKMIHQAIALVHNKGILSAAIHNAFWHQQNDRLVVLRGSPLAMLEWKELITTDYRPNIYCISIDNPLPESHIINLRFPIKNETCGYWVDGNERHLLNNKDELIEKLREVHQ